MTRDQLQASTKKTLIDLARQQGIAGWHDMTKEELIETLAKRSRSSSTRRPAARKAVPHPFALAPGRSRPGRRRPRHLQHSLRRGPGRKQQVRRRRADQGSVGQGAQRSAGRLRQGPHRRHGARSVLAALLLGADAPRHPAGRGRSRPGLAHGQADPAPARRQQPRHDQHVRVDPPRHRHPRRLQQLVHRRQQSAALLPRGHRLPRPQRPVLRPGPLQRRHHAARRRQRRHRRKLGRHRRQEGRPHLRHVRRLRSDRQQSRTEAAVRGTPAPAAGLAGRHQLRLRRHGCSAARRASSGSSSTPS